MSNLKSLKRTTDILFSPKYLLYTNVALGGTFLGLGDLIEQSLNKKIFNHSTDEEKLKKLKKNDTEIDFSRVCKYAFRCELDDPYCYRN